MTAGVVFYQKINLKTVWGGHVECSVPAALASTATSAGAAAKVIFHKWESEVCAVLVHRGNDWP